jgi:plastocyanin
LLKRRWPLFVAAVAGLVAAGFAAAASLVVALGPSGPQPSVVTVAWGDTLQLVNHDSVAHGLTSARPQLRAAAVAPGATFTDVVTGRAGPFVYHQTGGRRLDGTVVVALPGSVTLQATDASLRFGQGLLLSGKTNSAVPVAIEERLAGEPAWHTVATPKSGSDGAFAATLTLAHGGKVRASIDGGQLRSAPVAVSVAPRLTITVSPHRTRVGRRVHLRARMRPAGAATRVTLYVCSPFSGHWRRVAGTKPSATGVAVFRWPAVPGSWRLRVGLRRHDLALGYAPGTSARVTVTGTGKKLPVKLPARHHC